jgi:hypothetical protein
MDGLRFNPAQWTHKHYQVNKLNNCGYWWEERTLYSRWPTNPDPRPVLVCRKVTLVSRPGPEGVSYLSQVWRTPSPLIGQRDDSSSDPVAIAKYPNVWVQVFLQNEPVAMGWSIVPVWIKIRVRRWLLNLYLGFLLPDPVLKVCFGLFSTDDT